EYTTAQELHHTNLLTPSYFDIWRHRPYLVMKYCAKGSSAKYVGMMDEYMLWHFIYDVAAGLSYLHNLPEPIVHQDIKPYNVLVDDSGRFLITDFGISKKIRSTMRRQSNRAAGAGATSYMGPERFDANPEPIIASDIWSLGASIYEIATGELPFSGFGGGMQRNGAETPFLDNKWSKDMNMVMQSCLAKETWDRPTAHQLEEYSDAILKGRPAKVTWKVPDGYLTEDVEPENPMAPPKPRSSRALIWGAVCVVFILLCLTGSFLYRSGKIFVGNGKGEPIEIEAVEFPVVDDAVLTDEELVEDTTESGEVRVAEDEKLPVEKPVPVEGPMKETEVVKPKTESAVTSEMATSEQSAFAEIKNEGTDNGTKVSSAPKKKVSSKNENAEILQNALAEGNYQQVQSLANQGYEPAYGPLAKHYLSKHEYDLSEIYAKKAEEAGYEDGTEVLDALRKLGFYD
ncbi:MAG: protein kinase, partial [Bacteroidales bacterium]|nr:protein kinase [Bacteroidales bacterium]